MDWILPHEPAFRLFWFSFGLVTFASLEALRARRKLSQGRFYRWSQNLSLVAVDSLLLRVAFPLLAVDVAAQLRVEHWGLFQTLSLPLVGNVLLGLLFLDGAIYFQHRFFHWWRPLWRLHRVHHTDVDFDVTTALRFHPVEIALSMFIKMGLVVALGLAPITVILFEVVLNFSSMFNHANITLPNSWDAFIRKLIVTPDMHRVHHSIYPNETHSNFGFCLSIWDRIFKTYRDQPIDGHDKMVIGQKIYRDKKSQRLDQLIWQPFRKEQQRRAHI